MFLKPQHVSEAFCTGEGGRKEQRGSVQSAEDVFRGLEPNQAKSAKHYILLDREPELHG